MHPQREGIVDTPLVISMAADETTKVFDHRINLHKNVSAQSVEFLCDNKS